MAITKVFFSNFALSGVKKQLKTLLSCWLLTFAVSSTAYCNARDVLPTPPQSNVIYVATISQIDPEHPVVQLVRRAYAQIGKHMQLETMPLERLRLELNQGRLVDANLAGADTVLNIAPELLKIDVPIYRLCIGLFGKKNWHQPLGWPQLQPLRVVYVRGLNSIELLLLEHQVAQSQSVLSMQQALQYVEKDRADVAILPVVEAEFVLKNWPGHQVHALKQPALAEIPMYHFIHQRHRQLVAPLTKALQELTTQPASH